MNETKKQDKQVRAALQGKRGTNCRLILLHYDYFSDCSVTTRL